MTPPRDDRRPLALLPGSRWVFLLIGLATGLLAATVRSRHDASLAQAPVPAPAAPAALRPELAAIRSRVLEECETHGFSSSSYTYVYAPDLVETRKLLNLKECSAEDARAIVSSLDGKDATVFFEALADLGENRWSK